MISNGIYIAVMIFPTSKRNRMKVLTNLVNTLQTSASFLNLLKQCQPCFINSALVKANIQHTNKR